MEFSNRRPQSLVACRSPSPKQTARRLPTRHVSAQGSLKNSFPTAVLTVAATHSATFRNATVSCVSTQCPAQLASAESLAQAHTSSRCSALLESADTSPPAILQYGLRDRHIPPADRFRCGDRIKHTNHERRRPRARPPRRFRSFARPHRPLMHCLRLVTN